MSVDEAARLRLELQAARRAGREGIERAYARLEEERRLRYEREREVEEAQGMAGAYLKAGQEIAHTTEGLLAERDRLNDELAEAEAHRDAAEAALRNCPLHDDAQHSSWAEYVAANLFQALSVVPDTGDWHGALLSWSHRHMHDRRPNPMPVGFDAAAILRAQKERDRWIRLFNRLDKAVARHEEAKEWTDDADDALHHAWRQVLNAASGGGEA